MMPQKCTMAGCLNPSNNRDRWVVMPHVTELSFHTCPEPRQLPLWHELVSHGHHHQQELTSPHHQQQELSSSHHNQQELSSLHNHQQELPTPHHHAVCINHSPLGHPNPHHLSGYDHDKSGSDKDDNDVVGDDKEFVKASVQFRDVRDTDHDYPKLRRFHEGGVGAGDEKAGDLSTQAECKEEANLGDVESCVPDCESEKTLETSSAKEVEGGCYSSKSSADRVLVDSMDCVAVTGNMVENLGDVSSVMDAGSSVTLSEQTLGGEVSLTTHDRAVCGGRKRQASRDTDHIYNTRRSKCRKEPPKSTSKSSRSMRHTDSDHPYNSTGTNNTVASRQSEHCYNSRLSGSRSNRDCSFPVDSRQTDHPYNFRHVTKTDCASSIDVRQSDHAYNSRRSNGDIAKDSRQTDHPYNFRHGTKTDSASSLDIRQSDHAYNSRRCSNGDIPEDSRRTDHPYNFRHGTKTETAGHIDNCRPGANKRDCDFPKVSRQSDHQYNCRRRSVDKAPLTADSRDMDHCYNSTRHKPSVADSIGVHDDRETHSAHRYNLADNSNTSVRVTDRHIACPISKALDHPYTCRQTDRARNSSRSLRNRRRGPEHRYNNSRSGNGARSSAAIDGNHHQPNNSMEAKRTAVGDDESSSLDVSCGDHPYNSRPESNASSNTSSSEGHTRDSVYKDTDQFYRDSDYVYRNVDQLNRNTDHVKRDRDDIHTDADQVSRDSDHGDDNSPRTVVAAVSRDGDHMYNMPTPTLTKMPSTESCLPCSQANSQGQGPSSSSSLLFRASAASVDKDHMYQHSLRKKRQKADNTKAESRNSSNSNSNGGGGGSLAKKLLRHCKGSDRNNDDDTSSKCVEPTFKKTSPKKHENLIIMPKKKKVDSDNNDDNVSETEKKGPRRGGCVTRCGRKVKRRGWVKGQKKKKPLSRQGGSHPLADSTSTKEVPSPALSDVDCDPNPTTTTTTCDDDQSDVWRIDHKYVHFNIATAEDNNDDDNKDKNSRPTPSPSTPLSDVNNRQGLQPSLLSPPLPLSLSLEYKNYRQEHSYANIEEQRFAACGQCSGLVQQLIATIQQQCQHIHQLSKQLTAANATNRQLSARVSGSTSKADATKE